MLTRNICIFKAMVFPVLHMTVKAGSPESQKLGEEIIPFNCSAEENC